MFILMFFLQSLTHLQIFFFPVCTIDKASEAACTGSVTTQTSTDNKIVFEEIRHAFSKGYCWNVQWLCL